MFGLSAGPDPRRTLLSQTGSCTFVINRRFPGGTRRRLCHDYQPGEEPAGPSLGPRQVQARTLVTDSSQGFWGNFRATRSPPAPLRALLPPREDSCLMCNVPSAAALGGDGLLHRTVLARGCTMCLAQVGVAELVNQRAGELACGDHRRRARYGGHGARPITFGTTIWTVPAVVPQRKMQQGWHGAAAVAWRTQRCGLPAVTHRSVIVVVDHRNLLVVWKKSRGPVASRSPPTNADRATQVKPGENKNASRDDGKEPRIGGQPARGRSPRGPRRSLPSVKG